VESPSSYSFDPIGFVRSPFIDRASAPRQATVVGPTESPPGRGRIELLPGRGFEDAREGREEGA
jgi:hypothetical protein